LASGEVPAFLGRPKRDMVFFHGTCHAIYPHDVRRISSIPQSFEELDGFERSAIESVLSLLGLLGLKF
jgi:hypothetical protein